jgi:hypothetical protein
MIQVAAHMVPAERLAEAQLAASHLAMSLRSLPARPTFIALFALLARDAAGLSQSRGDSAQATMWLRRSARVSAFALGRAAFPHVTTPMHVDDVELGTVVGPMTRVDAAPFAWIDAAWCAMAVADLTAIRWLVNIPEQALLSLMVASGDRCDEYAFGLVELLRSVIQRDGAHASAMMRTLEALPPPDRCGTRLERQDEPSLRALFALMNRDTEGYSTALQALLEGHRAEWGSGGPVAEAPRGLVSLPACALERLARSLGVPRTLESAYAPPALWQAPGAS